MERHVAQVRPEVIRMFEKIKRWFQTEKSADEEADGSAVATPPPGSPSAELGGSDSETSTNAQMEGAADQPWPVDR